MTRVIYRYTVPVDDAWHDLKLSGEILHVAARNPYEVEMWAFSGSGKMVGRTFRVFGTGQILPGLPVRHVGTALTANAGLVWHLLESV